LCLAARFTGYQVDGGYADMVVAPLVYPIPATFSDEEAALLLCAGIICAARCGSAGFSLRQRLGMYGFGASAHTAIQIAHWGCEVYVIAESEHRALVSTWAPRGRAKPGSPSGSLHGSIICRPANWSCWP
jgi:propanol-preferring alcohol dehydrogenase